MDQKGLLYCTKTFRIQLNRISPFSCISCINISIEDDNANDRSGKMTNEVSNEGSFGRTIVGSSVGPDYYSITNKDISHNTINNNAVENELSKHHPALSRILLL